MQRLTALLLSSLKQIFIVLLFLSWMYAPAQNVGIGIVNPVGKLHIKGSEDLPQLVIDANLPQSNTKPIILLRAQNGNEMMRIHSDHLTNCFIGLSAGRFNTGQNNTFLGSYSGQDNTNGFSNTSVGSASLYKNNAGHSNTACGAAALQENVTGYRNCAIGYRSLFVNNGHSNIAIGYAALEENIIGNENVVIGTEAMESNVGGWGATAIGHRAMSNANDQAASFQTGNVAVGYSSLVGSPVSSANTGISNTALGSESLLRNSSGYSNTATGRFALNDNAEGYENCATGVNTLQANTNGFQNTANGFQALYSNTTGDGNTCLGMNTLYYNTIGNFNTAIGRSAYYGNNNLDNATAIGFQAGGHVEASNRIEIGNESVSWIGGQVSWGTYSDARIKDNIREDVPGLDFIKRLRPVTYTLNVDREINLVFQGKREELTWDSKYDIEKIRMTGFIAQEVEQAAQEIDFEFSGVQKPPKENELYSIRYSEFVMPLVKSVQELSAENEALRRELEEQKAIVEALVMKVNKMVGGE